MDTKEEETLEINVEFNDEIAWNDNRTLFTKHFEKKIIYDKHPISIIKAKRIHDNFDKNIDQFKSQFFNND